MRLRRPALAVVLALLACFSGATTAGQDPAPPGVSDPVLRLEAGGPLGSVTALAFSPDGHVLYETGWDKVVRVWHRDDQGRFVLDPESTLRVPIGPGDAGVMNALAVSPDGNWLAVGGNAVAPDGAGFRQNGLIVPRSSLADPSVQGVIYLFELAGRTYRQVKAYRGTVEALAFVDTPLDQPPLLLSAGAEFNETDGPKRRSLVLGLWDTTGNRLRDPVQAGELPNVRPWLAGWTRPPDHHRVRAAVAARGKTFQVWDLDARPARLEPTAPVNGLCTILGYWPERKKLLTGHFGLAPARPQPEGLLAFWDAAAPTAPQPRFFLKGVPVAQALVAARPGGPRNLLAVALEEWRNPPDPRGVSCTLQLLELEPGAGVVRAQVDLWRGPRARFSLAAAPDGSRLALAGGLKDEVRVAEVAALLGKGSAFQTLREAGDPVGAAAFVRSMAAPDDWGLLLRSSAPPAPSGPPDKVSPGDLVFDITRRSVAPATAAWSLRPPALGTWSITPGEDKRVGPPGTRHAAWNLWTFKERKNFGWIPLFPDDPSLPPQTIRLTAYALRPASARADSRPGCGRRPLPGWGRAAPAAL